MLGARIQLYLFIGAAFILGVVGIYASGVQRGIDRTKRKIDERRLENFRTAMEVEEEIEILNDTHLATRAKEWVRNKDETDL
jgi:hypothetical protein